jgi:carbon storage regulator CsrA
MLVLSRKKNEAIVFSTTQGDIVVEVVRVNGDKVRLGIELEDCDEEVSVHRKEVFDEIKRLGGFAKGQIESETEQFDALGDDEDGCGPDGSYVDQD